MNGRKWCTGAPTPNAMHMVLCNATASKSKNTQLRCEDVAEEILKSRSHTWKKDNNVHGCNVKYTSIHSFA